MVKKNAFLLFLDDKRMHMKNEGLAFPDDIKDAIAVVSPHWDRLSPEERLSYQEKAKYLRGLAPPSMPKQRPASGSSLSKGIPLSQTYDIMVDETELTPPATSSKTTNFGFSTSDIRGLEKENRGKAQHYRKDILQLLDADLADPREHEFMIIQCSTYCMDENGLSIPAELSLTSFSMNNGILANYSTLVDPGDLIPLGMKNEVLQTCKVYGLPIPPFSEACRDYTKIVAEFHEFLDLHPTFMQEKPMLFCLRPDMEAVTNSIAWLYKTSGIEEQDYQLRPLSFLFYQMMRIGSRRYDNEQKIRDQVGFTQLWSELVPEVDKNHGIPWAIKNGPVRARNFPNFENPKVETIHDDDSPPSDVDDDMRDDEIMDNEQMSPSPSTSTGGYVFPSRIRSAKSKHCQKSKQSPKPENPEATGGVFAFERDATAYLRSFDLAFNFSLGCPHHIINKIGIPHCTLNTANRYALNILDTVLGVWGVLPVEGLHYPSKSSEAEEEKRRALLLAMFGKLGYKDLPGFDDSIFDNVNTSAPFDPVENDKLSINLIFSDQRKRK